MTNVVFSNAPWWIKQVDIDKWEYGVRAGSRWPSSCVGNSLPDIYRLEYMPYPFFLGYATTYLQKNSKNTNVIFRDSISIRESMGMYFNFLKYNNVDFLFYETSTTSFDYDINILSKIKQSFPKINLVIVGPPVSTRAEEIMNYDYIYACIKGEYEKNSVKIIEGAKGILDFDLMSEKEINEAPFPFFNDDIVKKYWDGNPRGQVFPQAQIWSSRGCPFKCIFCSWPSTMTGNDMAPTKKRSIRYYNKEYMLPFLIKLKNDCKVKSIYFDDDTFNMGDKHTLEMCELMKLVGLPWGAMCRADTISKDTWKEMKDSGCMGVKIGYESGCQEIVNKMEKNLDLEKARETTLYLLNDLKLNVHGTFTYGIPGETSEQMEQTKRFIKSIPFTTIQESGCGVMDGTKLDRMIKEDKEKTDKEFINLSNGSKKMELINKKDSKEIEYPSFIFDYIITAFNSGVLHDFYTRLDNLVRSLESIPSNILVTIVEQKIPGRITYTEELQKRHLNNRCLIRYIVKEYDGLINKGWLYNIGVKSSVTPRILLSDMDVVFRPLFFSDLSQFIQKEKTPWCFCYDSAVYLNYEMTASQILTPARLGCEGTLVFFDKNFFFEMGGANEWIEGVAMLDNCLSERARLCTRSYPKFNEHIYHLHHERFPRAWGGADSQMRSLILQRPDLLINILRLFIDENGGEQPLLNKYSKDIINAGEIKKLIIEKKVDDKNVK